jgi:serine/threonine-protein kinase HipA
MVNEGRRSRVTTLGIWMNGIRVGTWRIAGGRDEFEYTSSWLDDPLARPLSLSMPFQPGNAAYRGELVSAWFDNLLPDSPAPRDRMARRFGATSTSPFALLEKVGRDCVGAVQVVPVDEDPGDVKRITGRPLSEAEIAQQLRDTVTLGPRIGDGDDAELRLSLAGAQEKTALLWHDGQWWLPTGTTPTTHIFKLPMGLAGNTGLDIEHSVHNEWLCAQILSAYGLPVARTEIATFEEHVVLVVERFDRRYVPAEEATPAWWRRLPQEDFCQATGTPPSRKYESDGGPGMDKILNVLAGAADAIGDRRNFLKAQILFWLLNAIDGHAKNFSVSIKRGGRFSLAPLYDVLSASPFTGEGPRKLPARRLKLAMTVRGTHPHRAMHEIMRRHWSAVSQRAGLGTLAEEIIAELLESTDEVIDRVSREIPAGFPEQISDSILSGLKTNSATLAAQPAE